MKKIKKNVNYAIFAGVLILYPFFFVIYLFHYHESRVTEQCIGELRRTLKAYNIKMYDEM